MHPHLQSEAAHQWQFTKLYACHAQPVQCEGIMDDSSYDIAEAWAEMRKRHAEECFKFIVQHQEQCVQLYDQEVEIPRLQQNLEDKLEAWFADREYNDAQIQHVMKAKARQFVENMVRAEKPKIQSRMAKEKENQAKREQALTEATSKWESMDVKDVLSPALLELSQLLMCRAELI